MNLKPTKPNKKQPKSKTRKTTIPQTNPRLYCRILITTWPACPETLGSPGAGSPALSIAQPQPQPSPWGEHAPLHLAGKAGLSCSGVRVGAKPALPGPAKHHAEIPGPKTGRVFQQDEADSAHPFKLGQGWRK